MAETHYDTLEVSQTATSAEIKQAYRQMAKRFHPDVSQDATSHERIAEINAAYEVLSDVRQRQSYDRQLSYETQGRSRTVVSPEDRHERAAVAQKRHRQRQTGRHSDEQLQLWLSRVYQPVNRIIGQIISPLKTQINQLAADPFDDDLLEDFQAYLEDCRTSLQRGQQVFRSIPNPPTLAGVAAHLYYCLNQVSDGIDELERFVSSYDDHYLHTGQELFRIASGLRREAQAAIRELA
jgi:molecular chaperone DnaJ